MGGPLRGGPAGKRLLESDENAESKSFDRVPAAFERRDGYLLVVPSYHLFGSEELSVLSPGIADLAAKPHILVNPEDAGRIDRRRQRARGGGLLAGVVLPAGEAFSDGPGGSGGRSHGAAGYPVERPAGMEETVENVGSQRCWRLWRGC